MSPALSLAATNATNHTMSIVARNVQTALNPNPTQRTTLIVAGVYIIVIAILWHIPYLNAIIYPFKLLTLGFTRCGLNSRPCRWLTLGKMSHAFMGVLTCATIHSIELDPDEGGATSMSGGIPWLTLPAGYLGSSLIGAALIACGFNTNASKIASIVLGVFFLFTLWWARRNLLTWVLILGTVGLILLFWFVADSVALRYLVLFVGVMSDMYVLWDVIDDTIARKVNSSDAYAFSEICGCCPSQVWGVIWLIQAFIFFAGGILVGLAAFKESNAQQKLDSSHFLPAPGSSSAGTMLSPDVVLLSVFSLILGAFGGVVFDVLRSDTSVF
ncbi:unnamed protein product [Mycena citricolor]|uniref:Uncharacterized protein n=1 Tax=Mycena citricolor TaxID=2018698 RepID=A0AAD2HQY1_9AGAR|nr:unnamed protein product [Mycena citricolor]